MIRNITAGYGIHVGGSNGHSTPYIDSTRPSAGMVRYINNNLEIYDGSNWMMMQSSYPQVELSGHVQAVIQWAEKKMAEEARLKDLAAKHPTVADAIEAVKQAEEQVRIVAALVDTA
jgi:hypothetical protein